MWVAIVALVGTVTCTTGAAIDPGSSLGPIINPCRDGVTGPQCEYSDMVTCNANGVALYTGRCRCTFGFSDEWSPQGRCRVCLDGHRGRRCQFSDQVTCNGNGVVDHLGDCTCDASTFGADCAIVPTGAPSTIPSAAPTRPPSILAWPTGGPASSPPTASPTTTLQPSVSPATPAPTFIAPTGIPTPAACTAGHTGQLCEYRYRYEASTAFSFICLSLAHRTTPAVE